MGWQKGLALADGKRCCMVLWDCPQRGTVTFPSTEGLIQRHVRGLEPEWLSITRLHFLIQLIVMLRSRLCTLQAMCSLLLFYSFISPLQAITLFVSVLGCVPQKRTTRSAIEYTQFIWREIPGITGKVMRKVTGRRRKPTQAHW